MSIKLEMILSTVCKLMSDRASKQTQINEETFKAKEARLVSVQKYKILNG